jgi:hypothetical protein
MVVGRDTQGIRIYAICCPAWMGYSTGVSAMNYTRSTDAESRRRPHGSMFGVYAVSAALMIVGLILISQ